MKTSTKSAIVGGAVVLVAIGGGLATPAAIRASEALPGGSNAVNPVVAETSQEAGWQWTCWKTKIPLTIGSTSGYFWTCGYRWFSSGGGGGGSW